MLDDSSSDSIQAFDYSLCLPSEFHHLSVQHFGRENVAYKWTIKNFHHLYGEDGEPESPKVSILYSKKFTAFHFNEFSIRLLPKYEADTGECFISISLFLESQTRETAPLSIDYQISLLDRFDQKCRSESMLIYLI